MAFIPQHKISILSSIWYIILTTWFQHPNILTSLTTLTIQPINQINCPNPLQLPRVIIYESVHCTACSVCNSWYTAEQELTYNISSWEQLWFFVVHITDKLRRRSAAQCYSQSYQCLNYEHTYCPHQPNFPDHLTTPNILTSDQPADPEKNTTLTTVTIQTTQTPGKGSCSKFYHEHDLRRLDQA